jgi:type IV pilus assembly protein PilW
MRTVRNPRNAGFSLVELMVAMIIAVLVMLGISELMATNEGQKRTTTSTNDIDQSASYAAYALDKIIRSAGSSFYQANAFTLGCELNAKSGSATILPLSSGFSSGFPNVTLTGVYLMPLLILPGQSVASDGSGGTHTSDVLVIMGGVNGNQPVPTSLLQSPTASDLHLVSNVGYAANDLLLISDVASGTNLTGCLLDQVSSVGTGGVVNLGGTYHAGDSISTRTLSSMSAGGLVIDLGNEGNGAPPVFELLGVGPDTTLESYDLITQQTTPVINGVFEMHALYGVDPTGTGTIQWVAPSGNYAVSKLDAGTTVATQLIQTIKAVRIGLILRTQLPEKTAVTPGPITLFSDLGSSLSYSRVLAASEQHYRYRTLDLTIPIQNTLQ